MDVVFFDASVLFKAAVTRFLLGAAQAGEFRAVWSAEVVEETRRNLIAADRVRSLAAFEQNIGLVRDPIVAAGSDATMARLTRTHPKDRHVLAAAADAAASVLVTDNVKHFDPNDAASVGIDLFTSDDFAARIAQRNPAALIRHVQRTPPDRLARYLEVLAGELPVTIGMIGPLFDEAG
jgi:predicted nucleic acid-binding protein